MTARIAHISDLHFGAVSDGAEEALLRDLDRERPRLVVVSGDLTQRARRRQFRAAAAFLQRVPAPVLVVQGNHDVPLFNMAARLLAGTRNYRRYIARDLDPFYADETVAVLGLNTARSLTWKDGRISAGQVERIRTAFADVPPNVPRAMVTHHPFLPPAGAPRARIVGRARQALDAFQQAEGDVLFCGHMHRAYAMDVGAYHAEVKRSILAIQAGTAISHRHRGEPNAYNLVSLAHGDVQVDVRQLDERGFRRVRTDHFRRVQGRWTLLEHEASAPRTGAVEIHDGGAPRPVPTP